MTRRPPDRSRSDDRIRAWRFTSPEPGVGPKDWEAGLVSWIIESESGLLDPMGLFTHWFLGGASLADREGVPPAHRHYPEAQFELSCWTINPEVTDPVAILEARRRTGVIDDTLSFAPPADIVYQFHGVTAEAATSIIDDMAAAIVDRALSPSRPPVGVSGGIVFPSGPAMVFDREWKSILDTTVQHYKTGHWPAAQEGRA